MLRHPALLRLAGIAAVVSLSAACSSGSDSAGAPDATDGARTESSAAATTPAAAAPTTTTPPTTNAPTTSEAPAPASFLGRGPFAVGVTTLTLGDRLSEVYYPVDPETVAGQPTEIFDSLSVFPESLQGLIPPELSGEVDTGAVRDATPTDKGPFPIIVYSHGFGGFRQVVTAHTTQLASWGFVVASTDHLERGIAAQATGQLKNIPGQDVRDVEATIDALTTGQFASLVDPEHIGITGHSAGAGTSARAALELDRIDAFVSISGGAPVVVTGDDIGTTSARLVGTAASHELTIVAASATEATITVDGGDPQTVPSESLSATSNGFTVTTADGTITLSLATDAALVPGTVTVERTAAAKPALVIYGELDEVVPPEASTALFGVLEAPRWMVGIEAAGHNSFTDSCAGIQDLGGLQSLVELLGEAQVARAEDGCTADNVDPALVIDVLGHYSVALFRTAFGIEDHSDALAVDITEQLDGVELLELEADA